MLWLISISLVCWLLCYCRDHIDSSSGSHLEPVTEDMETMDDNDGEQQGLAASSSSSEGDLELPTASGTIPSQSSPSRSRSSQPPTKPAPPRQRPSIPPRPKESTAAAAHAATNSGNSESRLEPTPFDLPDPFQDFEKVEEKESPGSAASDQEKKEQQQQPVPAPKPTRPPTMKKPQLSVDSSTKVSHYNY